MLKPIWPATVLIVATLSLSAATATAASSTTWYWTPAACKSALAKGVQTADGRYFYPTRSFCIGQAATCAWSKNGADRLYQSFYTIMQSNDGVVRSMYLNVTGKSTWSGNSLQLRFRYMDASKFLVYTRIAATAGAEAENAKGCKTGVFGTAANPGRAIAICTDGSYIHSGETCAGHGGLLGVLP